jgi:ribulose 1,5-bisphosphate synthetase/thiazole synthase
LLAALSLFLLSSNTGVRVKTDSGKLKQKMAVNVIRREGGYQPGACTHYPVLIVGAGISGIAMGCRLKEKLKFDQFRIVERQSGIGGTWWINRYPGVACDV